MEFEGFSGCEDDYEARNKLIDRRWPIFNAEGLSFGPKDSILTPSGLENAILTAWWEIEIEKRVIFAPEKSGGVKKESFYFNNFFKRLMKCRKKLVKKWRFRFVSCELGVLIRMVFCPGAGFGV